LHLWGENLKSTKKKRANLNILRHPYGDEVSGSDSEVGS